MPYYAHKEIMGSRVQPRFYLLSDHLANVACGAARRLWDSAGQGGLWEHALLAGLTHDFGKHTSFFQDYLRDGGEVRQEKQHAFISGLWAAHVAQGQGMGGKIVLALFLAVTWHHRSLADPHGLLLPPRDINNDSWDALEPTQGRRLKILKKQVEGLQGSKEKVLSSLKISGCRARRLLDNLHMPVPAWLEDSWEQHLESFFSGWKDTYGRLFNLRRKLVRECTGELEDYFTLLTLFSSLIDADKVHAARVKEPERPRLPCQPVEDYRQRAFGSPSAPMDAMREDLYATVCRRVHGVPLDQDIFTLTAPTGSGKTLAGMAAAFILRGRLSSEDSFRPGIVPRLIYSLPFTNIVDNTYNECKKVLLSTMDGNPDQVPSPWLLKHHYLADIEYRAPGGKGADNGHFEEEKGIDKALLLVESWQSEIIVTTFVQVLHTLIGGRNRMLKKFHRFRNAVLILDEVQNIPVEYWPLVESTLAGACKYLGTRVLLMTATRPAWFAGKTYELAGEPEAVRQRFYNLRRVKVELDLEPICTEGLVESFTCEHEKDLSYMIVLNTIKSSIRVYEGIKDYLTSQGVSLYYLSTNIVPAERERRLDEIKERLGEGKLVLVSTQVVEAGVDLDFSEAWRDLASFDSIVQVAGRCNRHGKGRGGRVRLFHLVEEDRQGKDKTLAEYVYGKIHIRETLKLLEGKTEIEEPEFFDLVANYFNAVARAKSQEESALLLKAMKALQFEKKHDTGSRQAGGKELGVDNFALIKEPYQHISLFIEVDEEAQGVWQAYQERVAREKDINRRQQAYLQIKRHFISYVISVPAKMLVYRLPEETKPYRIPLEMLEEYYDRETGFKYVADHQVLIF